MTLYKEHRTPRTFNCLKRIVTPNKRCFCITQNSVRIQKPKPNGWKTQSDFVKRKMVLEIYMYKNKCVKLRMF